MRYFDNNARQWVEGEPPKAPEPQPLGPGGHLKRLLAGAGIVAGPRCACNAMALKMDVWGPDECMRRLEEIVAVMVTEATRRDWFRFAPFKEMGARMIVRKAIERARG